MIALPVVEQRAAARLHIDGKRVALNGTALVGCDDDRAGFLVEADEVHHHPLSAGELATLACFQVIEVEVVIAVALALEEELLGIPRQECHGVLRLHIFR